MNTEQLLGYLLLISALILSPASYGDHDHSKSNTANLKSPPHGGGLFVTATFGPDDRLWRVVPEKEHVYVDYSTDLGRTFSTPVRINGESQRVKASRENRPGIVVDGSGRIYVIYAAEGTQPIAQYISVSIDNGRNFSTPRPLSTKASEANSSLGHLALSPAGKVYIFWLDERDRTDWRKPGNAMYFTTIIGQGEVDFINQKLSDTLCECCRIAVAFDPESHPVLLARFIYPGDIRDHGLLKVQTDGKLPLSWRVTFDQWKLEGCPEHGPAISIANDDRYHIAWFTQGSVRQGLFYAYSSDGGQHFSNPLPLGDVEKLPGHPDILAQGKNVILTWTEFDGDKTHLFIMQSNDKGQSWAPAQSIAESTSKTDSPFLLASTQGIFVSWNSKKEGYRLISLN
ncbi:sialidase family protein [Nitrosospira sp. NpAV]|uniref:sialidase family protein n=1 Tax=Nitrosospira sp. NpAV TaxID=58133 RepID=UPI0005A12126|nr:sialidase family protein [Nitrosospira sp. NpAV]KIO48672.1 hypothetical protein SQ11_10360 [Nitrosospira sp. NpAV]